MKNKHLNYESSIRELRGLISCIQEPSLRQQLYDWVNYNLQEVRVQYVTDPQVANAAADYHIKELLTRRLAKELVNVSIQETNETWVGYPQKISTLSLMLVGKFNYDPN